MMAAKAPLPRTGGCPGLAWRRRSLRPWSRRQQIRWSPEALLTAMPSFPRPVLARLTERLIDRMDEIDGHPDREAEPDGEDGQDREDVYD